MDELEIALFKVWSDYVEAVVGAKPYLLDAHYPHNVPERHVALRLAYINDVSEHAGYISTASDTYPKGRVFNTYEGSMIIRVYGQSSMSIAQTLRNSLKDPTVRDILSAGGVGYSATSQISNDSVAVDNQKIEQRASFSVSFYFVQGDEGKGDDYGWFEDVTFDPTYINY